MRQIKKTILFSVEVYKLKHYWITDNFQTKRFNWSSELWEPQKTTRYSIKPDCFERTHHEMFNSVRKLNKALGLKKKKYYSFYKNLNEVTKGVYGDNFYYVKNTCDEVLIIRQLHDLDKNYTYYSK